MIVGKIERKTLCILDSDLIILRDLKKRKLIRKFVNVTAKGFRFLIDNFDEFQEELVNFETEESTYTSFFCYEGDVERAKQFDVPIYGFSTFAVHMYLKKTIQKLEDSGKIEKGEYNV